MANIFETRKRLDGYIEMLALNRVDSFYPSALAKHLNVSSIDALNLLLERSGKEDQLILRWEIRCPECYRKIKVIDEQEIGEEIDCNCGEEFELKLSDLFPVFQINPSYKKFIIEERKKKSNLSQTPFQLV